jgi:Periplasmic binding protein
MKRLISIGAVLSTAAILAVPALPATAAVKAGQSCKKLGEVKNGLTCTKQGTKRVYKGAPVTTVAAPPSAGATPTTAAAPAGLANVPGFDGKTINIGYLGNVSANDQFPNSLLFADGGKALTAGFNAVVDRLNASGGIAGKYKLKPIFKETYYTPAEIVKAYNEIKNDVVMIGQIYGTPGTQTLVKSLAEDNMVGSPISLDSAWVKNPNILPVGGVYQAQAINLIDYSIKEAGQAGKTFCSLALAGAYGDAGDAGFTFAAAKLNLKVGVRIKASTAPAQAQQLKDGKCDVVIATISGESGMTPMLTETAKLDYFPLFYGLGPSFAARSITPANSAQYAKQVVIANDAPQWGDTSIPGMKSFIDDMKKSAPQLIGNPNGAAIWGQANARAVIALLEKAVANNDLSRDGIKKALSQVGPVKNDGMFPDWDYGAPADRVGPAQSYMAVPDISVPGGLRVIKAFTSDIAKQYK